MRLKWICARSFPLAWNTHTKITPRSGLYCDSVRDLADAAVLESTQFALLAPELPELRSLRSNSGCKDNMPGHTFEKIARTYD